MLRNGLGSGEEEVDPFIGVAGFADDGGGDLVVGAMGVELLFVFLPEFFVGCAKGAPAFVFPEVVEGVDEGAEPPDGEVGAPAGVLFGGFAGLVGHEGECLDGVFRNVGGAVYGQEFVVQGACLVGVEVAPPMGAVAIVKHKVLQGEEVERFLTVAPVLVQCLGELAAGAVVAGDRDKTIDNMQETQGRPERKKHGTHQQLFVFVIIKKKERKSIFLHILDCFDNFRTGCEEDVFCVVGVFHNRL